MLAISRAFINSDGLLLIDEPSKGLSPIMIEKLMIAIFENEGENNSFTR